MQGAERLLAGDAGPAARLELGAVLNGHAALRIEAGDLAGARALHGRALPLLLELADATPTDPRVLHEAAVACMNSADLLEPGAVEPTLRRGLELASALAADYPSTPEYGRVLGFLRMNLAVALLPQGRVEEAEGLLQQALASGQDLLRREPGVFDNLYLVGQAGMNLATLRVQLERRGEACEPGAAAGEALEAARTLSPGDPRVLYALAWARLQEGYGRVARGEAARAESLATSAPTVQPEDAMVQVAAAEVPAGCIPLRPGRAEALAVAVLERLQRGLELGFPDLGYLRQCRELEPVRALPRFEALLQAAAAGPGGG
jgi:tetratricopeptide (TPR) repeat protein